MQMTMSRFNNRIESDKLPNDVFVVSPLQFQKYEDGELVFELSANEGRLVTTGKMTAVGNAQLRLVDKGAPPEFRLATLRSERIVAVASRATTMPFDLLGTNSKFERVEFPGEVEINSRGHQMLGRAFHFDAINFKLMSSEAVQVIGPGRRIEARGVESDFKSKTFKFAGPVKGLELPSVQHRQSSAGRKVLQRQMRKNGKEK